MRVTPTLVQAAEAVLRDALEPALAIFEHENDRFHQGTVVEQVRLSW